VTEPLSEHSDFTFTYTLYPQGRGLNQMLNIFILIVYTSKAMSVSEWLLGWHLSAGTSNFRYHIEVLNLKAWEWGYFIGAKN